MSDTIKIAFSTKDVLFKNLLLSPERLDYGTENTLEGCNAEIQIGQRPIVRNLRKLYELKGSELPADMKVFEAYDIWLITFAIGIMGGSGLKKNARFSLIPSIRTKTWRKPM